MIAIDVAGEVVTERRAALPESRRVDGHSEQDPEAWWRAVTDVMLQLDIPLRRHVRAISVDGTSSSLLLCDARGRPCSPALMYDDTRARDAAQRIAQLAPPDSPARGAGPAVERK